MKESKVTKVEKWDGTDSLGNERATITFENGDTGYYFSRPANISYFKEGEVAKYEIERKKNKKGEDYFRVFRPKEEETTSEKPSYSGSKYTPKDYKKEAHYMAITMAAAYAKDLVVAKVIEMKDFESHYEIILNVMLNKIDNTTA